MGGPLVGDALQMQIDGLNDGITRPGQDDHDWMFDTRGRGWDYNRPIPGATVVARTTPGSNWRVEARIPLSSIWSTIGAGSVVGFIVGLWDNDTQTDPEVVDQVMIGPPQGLALPTATP